MMRSNTIFVEGVADERFIWQLAEHLFGDISERKIQLPCWIL
jgi:hypothetical protein